MSQQVASSGGIGLFGILGVVFIVLKLTGNIAWSWWWVLAPFWAPAAIAIVVVLLVVLLAAMNN